MKPTRHRMRIFFRADLRFDAASFTVPVTRTRFVVIVHFGSGEELFGARAAGEIESNILARLC